MLTKFLTLLNKINYPYLDYYSLKSYAISVFFIPFVVKIHLNSGQSIVDTISSISYLISLILNPNSLSFAIFLLDKFLFAD